MNIAGLLLIKLSNCGQEHHLASPLIFYLKQSLDNLICHLPGFWPGIIQLLVPAGHGFLTNRFIMNGWLDWIIRKQTNSLLPVQLSNNNNNKYHSTSTSTSTSRQWEELTWPMSDKHRKVQPRSDPSWSSTVTNPRCHQLSALIAHSPQPKVVDYDISLLCWQAHSEPASKM